MHVGASDLSLAFDASLTAMVEIEPVPDDLAELVGHGAEHALDGGVVELIDASAGDADEVMVMAHPVQRVERGAIRELGLAEDADVHEQPKGAVDGGAPQRGHPCDDFLRGERTGPPGEKGGQFTAWEGHAVAVFLQGRQDVRLGCEAESAVVASMCHRVRIAVCVANVLYQVGSCRRTSHRRE